MVPFPETQASASPRPLNHLYITLLQDPKLETHPALVTPKPETQPRFSWIQVCRNASLPKPLHLEISFWILNFGPQILQTGSFQTPPSPRCPDLMGQRVKDSPEEFTSEVQLFL